MKFLPDSEYAMIHGQCLSVGVGGYLLGGGANILGTTAKYGGGMEHVTEYTMVTAKGQIVKVNRDNVTHWGDGGREVILPY